MNSLEKKIRKARLCIEDLQDAIDMCRQQVLTDGFVVSGVNNLSKFYLPDEDTEEEGRTIIGGLSALGFTTKYNHSEFEGLLIYGLYPKIFGDYESADKARFSVPLQPWAKMPSLSVESCAKYYSEFAEELKELQCLFLAQLDKLKTARTAADELH